MKKMRIEKKLVFADPVQRILELKVSEGFTYKQEEDGIRAVGPLYIRGKYGCGEEQKFQEVLEMDVLAPKEKLSGESFYLEVGEYEGKPDTEGINVQIQLFIHGLLEEGQSRKEETEQYHEPQHMETIEIPVQEENSGLSKTAAMEALSLTDENKEAEAAEAAKEESTSDAADIDSIEDLFEGAENVYTSYRMIVAKPNDTYASIAQRYDCEESTLRETNRNKDVVAKTLIILPYADMKPAED